MLKKKFTLALFFIFNLFFAKFNYWHNYSLFCYFALLVFQIWSNKEHLSFNLKLLQRKINFISVYKLLMLSLLFLIVLKILNITSLQKTNTLTMVFNNPNFLVNLINDYLLKPTIIFTFAYNFKQNLKFKGYIVIAMLFSMILNCDIVINFTFHKFNIFLNWTFIYYVLFSINLYFYNYLYIWIVFLTCNICNFLI